jgi:hypothetical protein
MLRKDERKVKESKREMKSSAISNGGINDKVETLVAGKFCTMVRRFRHDHRGEIVASQSSFAHNEPGPN